MRRVFVLLSLLLFVFCSVKANTFSWASDTDWQKQSNGDLMRKQNGITLQALTYSAINVPAFGATEQDLRIYANGALEVSVDAGSFINQVDFRLSSQGLRRLGTMGVSEGQLTYDIGNATVTWKGNSNKFTIYVGDYADLGTDPNTRAQFCINSPVEVKVDGELTDDPIPDSDVITIADAHKLAKGKSCAVRGSVCATGMSGFLIGDGTDYIYYYNPGFTTSYKLGDIVKISGTLGSYGRFNQFENGAEIIVEGHAYPVLESPETLDAKGIEAWMAAPKIKKVEVEGEFYISDGYYDLAFPGTSIIGSLNYCEQNMLNKLEEYKSYVVTGYAFMSTSNNRFMCIIANDIREKGVEVESPSEATPEIPVGSVCLNFTTSDNGLNLGQTLRNYHDQGISVIFSSEVKVEKSSDQYKAISLPSGCELTISSDNENPFYGITFGLGSGALKGPDNKLITRFQPFWKGQANSVTFKTTEETEVFYVTVDYAGKDDTEFSASGYRIDVKLPTSYDKRMNGKILLERNLDNGAVQKFAVGSAPTYGMSNISNGSSIEIHFTDTDGSKISEPYIATINGANLEVELTPEFLPAFVTRKVKVAGPDGEDLSSKVNIEWYDSEKHRVAKGPEFSEALSGREYTLKITLDSPLNHQYNSPAPQILDPTEVDDSYVVKLEGIKSITLTGRVVDSKDGSPIYAVDISVTQKYSDNEKNLALIKTDSNGEATISGKMVDTEISIFKEGYIPQVFNFSKEEIALAALASGAKIDIGDMPLKQANGTKVTVNLSYRDIEGKTKKGFSDLKNIDITAIDKSTGTPYETMFNYPELTVLDPSAVGKEILFTLISKKEEFSPVKTKGVLSENNMEIDFEIKENGAIRLSADSSADGCALLYNSKGILLSSNKFSEGSATFYNLPDGTYKAVAIMIDDPSVWTNISMFDEAKLEKGKDYLLISSIPVSVGTVNSVEVGRIPFFDSQKLKYTGDGSSVGLNKLTVPVGNPVTLTAFIDFKEEYTGKVSNLELIAILPEELRFIDNSVMEGSKSSPYSYDRTSGHLSVPMQSNGGKIRFCFSPLESGEIPLGVSIKFNIDGKTVTQPVSSVKLTSNNLRIEAPSVVTDGTITVSGECKSESDVRVYDGNVLIGNTKADANGNWRGTFELYQPYNLSNHSLQAKLTDTEGIEYSSEIVSVLVNSSEIIAEKVTMLNIDHGGVAQREQVTVFNLKDKVIEGNEYYTYWPAYPDFSFIVDLNDNRKEAVESLSVVVYTTKDEFVPLLATFNDELGRWTATGSFSAASLPIGVSVKIYSETSGALDRRQIEDYDKETSEIFENFWREVENGIQDDTDDDWDDSEYMAYLESLSLEELEALASQADLIDNDELDSYLKTLFVEDLTSNPDLAALAGITYLPYKETSEEILLAEGFSKVDFVDGIPMYIKNEESACEIIDPYNSQHMRIEYKTDSQAVNNFPAMRSNGFREDIGKRFEEAGAQLNTIIQGVYSKYNELTSKFSNILELLEAEVAKYTENIAVYIRLIETEEDEIRVLQMGLQTTKDPQEIANIEKKIDNYKKSIERHNKRITSLRNSRQATKTAIKRVGELKGLVGKALGVAKFAAYFNELRSLWSTLDEMKYLLPLECKCDPTELKDLENELRNVCISEIIYFVTRAGVDIADALSSAAATVASAGTAIPLVTVKHILKKIIVDLVIDAAHSHLLNNWKKSFSERASIMNSRCSNCDDDDNDNPPPCQCSGRGNCKCFFLICRCPSCNDKPWPQVLPIQDPSGFVYEGYESKRIKDVEVSLYLKRQVEDIYGDTHEEIVLWDAARYGQQNPLLTDENGFYRWDVPEGLWQARFKKEGYESFATDWLPVPPPQLDINVSLLKLTPPTVESVNCTPNSLFVDFDSYMAGSSITASNIFVKENGIIKDGVIQFIDGGSNLESPIVSRIAFIPTIPFETNEVEILINKGINSYNGQCMVEDYRAKIKVMPEISSIEVAPEIFIATGHSEEIAVRVLPVSASVGLNVYANIVSSNIATVSQSVATVDSDGYARFNIEGRIDGSTAVLFKTEGLDFTTTTTVHVSSSATGKVVRPKASIPNNSLVESGSLLYLSCNTPGAAILYTTDGTDPTLYPDGVIRYNNPIGLTEDIVIRAFAVADDMDDSDIAEFHYYVSKTPSTSVENLTVNDDIRINITPLPVGEIMNVEVQNSVIKRVRVIDMNGALKILSSYEPTGMSNVSLNVSKLSTGIYIVVVETTDGIVSRRVLKK